MRTSGIVLSFASVALMAACSRGGDARPDDALKSDLALAAQVQPYQAQQFVSPNELQQGATRAQAPQYNAARNAPVYRAPAPARRTSRAPARASRSDGGYYPNGGSYPSTPREPVRHTQRDAAIGAAAGAVLGASTSQDRVKGGLIGAAAGGILGGIIGHTVDVQHP